MTKREIFEIISDNPAFHLATVEGEQPRVRGMLLYKADDEGIIFHTGAMKDLYRQIVSNSKAELCFNDFSKGVQVRISGELEILDDNKLKDEICEHPSRQFLKPWRENGSLQDFYKTFIVLKVKNAVAVAWTMATNFAPKDKIEL